MNCDSVITMEEKLD